MSTIIERLKSPIQNYPKTVSLFSGIISALAMAPTFYWPLLLIGVSLLVLAVSKIERPFQAAWSLFMFGMGFFTLGLYWIANALMLRIEDYWWAIAFCTLGLPVLLSLLWFVAGYVTVRLTAANTLARACLLLTLWAAAEYGRAFNLSGFPWNLFGYAWGFSEPIMQVAALGGAYLLTALTMMWMATPALLWIARGQRLRQGVIAAVTILSFGASWAYGAHRLSANPTQLRDDTMIVDVQPNIAQDEKWEPEKVMIHFMKHVELTREALAKIVPNDKLKSVAVIWPETALDESLIMQVPDAPKAILSLMHDFPFPIRLVTGLWRESAPSGPGKGPRYYNSLAIISPQDGKLNLDALYDKHHLVPFGEFLPMEKLLNLTPLVGFAGFQWGTGPKTLQSEGLPPVAPTICFESIFPWYAASPGAEWMVNTANDGWYGNTSGPYQHLTMNRYRAVEEGKPMVRSTTTGVSAIVDSYGRVVQSLPYLTSGAIVSALPAAATRPTLYSQYGEALFFIMIFAGVALAAGLRFRKI